MVQIPLFGTSQHISSSQAGTEPEDFVDVGQSSPSSQDDDIIRPFSKPSSASPLTPKQMLSLPRPTAGNLNPRGTLYAWGSSNFSFSKKKTYREVWVGTIPENGVAGVDGAGSSKSVKVLESLAILPSPPVWLDDHTLLYLRPPASSGDSFDVKTGESDEEHKQRLRDEVKIRKATAKAQGNKDNDEVAVEIWAVGLNPDISKALATGKKVKEPIVDNYKLGALPVEVGDLGFVSLGHTNGILSFSAEVFQDGDLFRVIKGKKRVEELNDGAEGLVYTSVMVRHWDHWLPDSALKLLRKPFCINLRKSSTLQEDNQFSSRWEMERERDSIEAEGFITESETADRPSIASPLAGNDLECPVGPFGGSDDWSVSDGWLAFIAKDPLVPPAWHTRTNVYVVPLRPRSPSDSRPRLISSGTTGACANPVFDAADARPAEGVEGGKGKLVWLEMREDGYESDRNRVMVYDFETSKRYGVTEEWDRSPDHVTFCPCRQKVYLTAEEHGHAKLFSLIFPDNPSSSIDPPQVLTEIGSVTAVQPLPDFKTVFLTITSLSNPNQLYLLNTPTPEKKNAELKLLASMTKDWLEPKALDRGEAFWYTGAANEKVHGWILRPPNFKPGHKKYPLAFLIHGGPHNSWMDAWSTRWNPNVFTAAGFIVVSPNVCGSTGFGQEFSDALRKNWTGAFKDVVAGLHHVLDTYEEIDPDRTTALGASFGGWACNWIQGHNDITKFKAIVSHDGIFSASTAWYGTEELFFLEAEFGGTPWQNPEGHARFDPKNHVSSWRTPMLIIHSDKDYRLPITEGTSAFNTLQRLGVPSKLLVFENENHWVLKPANSAQWHHEVLSWIKTYTAPHQSKRGYEVAYVQ